jgi:glycerol-3-phosphate O-acyltransferase
LFKTALRLARFRELVSGAEYEVLAPRRREFLDQVATAVRRVNTIAELARAR